MFEKNEESVIRKVDFKFLDAHQILRMVCSTDLPVIIQYKSLNENDKEFSNITIHRYYSEWDNDKNSAMVVYDHDGHINDNTLESLLDILLDKKIKLRYA